MKVFKNISLQARLTILFLIISSLMCICLTFATFHVADDIIEALPLTPPYNISEQSTESLTDIKEITPATLTTPATAKQNFRYTTTVILIGIIFLGSILTYLISGKMLKPLKTLTTTVGERTAETLADTLPLPKAQDEIFHLTKAFNRMSSEVSKSYTEQKNFSANAAHELRTPLAVLRTKIDVLLLKKDRPVSEYDALLNIFSDNLDRLSDVVQNLLTLASHESFAVEMIAIDQLLEETVYGLEDIAFKKNISIQLDVAPCTIQGNDGLLQQAIYNILINAINYNVPKGEINVHCRGEKDSVIIRICDTGVGISDQHKQMIFIPFFRVDSSRNRNDGGSGLGLAMVKNIIERHGGSISVSDNTPSGTCFTIEISN